MASTEDDPRQQQKQEGPYLRETLCIASQLSVLRTRDAGFVQELSQQMAAPQSNMLEKTALLKARLRQVSTFDFWQTLMGGMAEITGSQYSFVAKRMTKDNENSAVEMPPFGEQGSCLMALAFYFNDHKGKSALSRDYKYQVYGCPCQWMRHDRVLLIPDNLSSLTPNNPNTSGFPIPAEGYLAVPLFHEGKCFAHFGCMWTADGLKSRPDVSWGMLEMFLHALEDLVAARILSGLALGDKDRCEIVPQSADRDIVAVKPSLRPYARRLSHELRTPMQGVVGMLDVMYASVLEAMHPERWRWPDLDQLKEVVEGLRSSIEVAQDSSKRAVDAADNMVHAYDFNMEVPSTPSKPRVILGPDEMSQFVYTENDIDSHKRIFKRRRSSITSDQEMPHKVPHIENRPSPGSPPANAAAQIPRTLPTNNPHTLNYGGLSMAEQSGSTTPDYFSQNPSSLQAISATPGLFYDSLGKVVINSRPLKLRELLHEAVHESLRTGGRPDFTKITETPRGEQVIVEVAEARSGEEERMLVVIEVIVEKTVPDSLIIDGSYLMKMISSVFHNAFKFTPSGRITLNASVSSARQIIISIVDTGDGIPEDFLPDLFKPFSTEDESLTRPREGLGLGLYVAKGIARKMGGDLWCERTATEGDNRGSEFRIRLPITPADASGSTPTTPLPTPAMTPDLAVSVRLAPPLPPARSPPPAPSTTARKLSFDPDLAKKLPLRILVVEDNRINRALLCSMLKRLGYNDIEEARDGVEAVEIFSAALLGEGTQRFDLVLMDLWMPRMDGYEAAERIVKLYNERGENGGITVLAVSADATEEARAKAVLKGMHGFVGKPFGIADLGKAVVDYRGGGVAVMG